MHRFLGLLLAVAMATGCGGGAIASSTSSDPPQSTPTGPPPTTSAQTFTIELPTSMPKHDAEDEHPIEDLGGGTVTYKVVTAADDCRVEDLEAYRTAAGAPEVTYLLVTVDNSGGRGKTLLPDATATLNDDTTIHFDSVKNGSPVLKEWAKRGKLGSFQTTCTSKQDWSHYLHAKDDGNVGKGVADRILIGDRVAKAGIKALRVDDPILIEHYAATPQ